jgi:hypothetical protein
MRDDVSTTSTEDETEEQQESPMQGFKKGKEVISIVEEGDDPAKFKFHYIKNGTKKLKDKKQHVANRWHFKCNQHDNKDIRCTTMYKVTVPLANPNDKHVFFLQEKDRIHNHQPPTALRKRGRMDVDQKERVADYLSMGVKLARIHQQLVIENPRRRLPCLR